MSTSNICAKQEVAELIKDEPACDADDVKVDGSYRPRPELPKPQVILRSLAELMSGRPGRGQFLQHTNRF